jgi:hypothetical protein
MWLLSALHTAMTFLQLPVIRGQSYSKTGLLKRGIESETLLDESSDTRVTVVCLCLLYVFLLALSQGD